MTTGQRFQVVNRLFGLIEESCFEGVFVPGPHANDAFGLIRIAVAAPGQLPPLDHGSPDGPHLLGVPNLCKRMSL